ncbi:MAG: hypothetical protein ACXVZN_00185 [Gaiellaceae bacterium]
MNPALATATGSKTLVSAFESGRAYNGGASSIGWATSVNGGKSFKHGLVPLTVQAGGPGTIWRGADPSVAYNARYGKWLVAATGMGSLANTLGLYASSSVDGKSWSAPIQAHAAGTGDTPSQSRLTCDNTSSSAGYGNCYLAYTNTASTPANQLQVTRSTDGGTTWSAAVGAAGPATGTQVEPQVQPPAPSATPGSTCGRVVVPYAPSGTTVSYVASSDCGLTFGAAVSVTSTQAAQHTPAQGLRVNSPGLSSSTDGAGGVYLTWQTRSFRITQTTLSAAANAGDTNIKVGSVTGMVAGNTLTVDTGANAQTVTITTVGTAGSTGTGITFTPALTAAHALGAVVTVNGVASTSAAAPNDIALAVMPAPTDATPAPNFGSPSRIAIESDAGATSNTVDHFTAAIAGDSNTSGASAHLALFYYFYPLSACQFVQDLGSSLNCHPSFGYVSSKNAGGSWSAPQTLVTMDGLPVLPRTGPVGTTGNGNPDLGLYTSAAVIPFGPLEGNAISVFDYGLTANHFDLSMYVPSHGLAIGGGS